MISYFILAVFTTLYFVVLLPTSFRSPQAEATGNKTRNWVAFFVSGFRKSLNTFQEYVTKSFWYIHFVDYMGFYHANSYPPRAALSFYLPSR